MIKRGFSRWLWLVALGVCLAGCSHYQLGTQGKLSFNTLYVAPVANTAGLPQAQAIFSTQLREIFLHDGRVTLVNSPEQADAVLKIDLSRYVREVATTRTDDTGLARKFDLRLYATCTLRDQRNNQVLFENRPVEVTREIFTTPTPEPASSDQLQAEYQAVPLLASSLADKIAHTVLDTW